MKKLAILILAMIPMFVFAEEAILIDFSALTAEATTLDYSAYLHEDYQGANNTISLAIENWNVELNSSARTLERQQLSCVLPAHSQSQGTVLGIRAHFPTWGSNAYADVIPPFEIPVFTEQGVSFESAGIVTNVGNIREIRVNVYGGNFPHELQLILEDETGEQFIIPMGSLQFLGWQELVWKNPAYISNASDRDLFQSPRYPTGSAFIKLVAIRIFRPGSAVGGDSITYIKDISISFDQSTLIEDTDFDEEGIWGIIEERETTANAREMERLAIQRYLIEQEELKMDTSTSEE